MRPLGHCHNENANVKRRESDFACVPTGRDVQSECASLVSVHWHKATENGLINLYDVKDLIQYTNTTAFR